MCVEATAAEVRSRPVWDWDEDMAADVGDAQAVLYVGVAGSGAVGLWDGLHELDPSLWLLGTDGVAEPRLAREMSAGAAARTRFFSTRHAPWSFYGYEAIALVRDAIAAGGDRAGVVAGRAFDTRPRLRARALLDRRARPHDEHRVRGARGGGRGDRVGRGGVTRAIASAARCSGWRSATPSARRSSSRRPGPSRRCATWSAAGRSRCRPEPGPTTRRWRCAWRSRSSSGACSIRSTSSSATCAGIARATGRAPGAASTSATRRGPRSSASSARASRTRATPRRTPPGTGR